MGAHQAMFLVLGAVVLGSAILVVTVRNIVHAALNLVVCFAGVAGLYVLLQAEFLAVAQVLIYIGAITVLILFAIMLTRHITGLDVPPLASHWKLSLAAVLLFAPALVRVATSGAWRVAEDRPADSTTHIGLALVQQFVLPFELASVILLAALVGAVVLARDERRSR